MANYEKRSLLWEANDRDQRVHSAKESRLFLIIGSECFPDNGRLIPEGFLLDVENVTHMTNLEPVFEAASNLGPCRHYFSSPVC